MFLAPYMPLGLQTTLNTPPSCHYNSAIIISPSGECTTIHVRPLRQDCPTAHHDTKIQGIVF
jgi:hypothetical protein